jgi:hypothetical protein
VEVAIILVVLVITVAALSSLAGRIGMEDSRLEI